MRCSYIYFMKDNPDRVAAVAPEHAAYWRGLELREYLGGPFADRSGGLISFQTDSHDDAAQLVAHDPFRSRGTRRPQLGQGVEGRVARLPRTPHNDGSRRGFG